MALAAALLSQKRWACGTFELVIVLMAFLIAQISASKDDVAGHQSV